jgi:hypothetical protein
MLKDPRKDGKTKNTLSLKEVGLKTQPLLKFTKKKNNFCRKETSGFKQQNIFFSKVHNIYLTF